MTHTVFASYFRRPLPRWADEGACTTVEHQSERGKQERMLIDFLRTGRGIAFSQMFVMTEYPQDILPLYAQGYALARFLIDQKGKHEFLSYLKDGMSSDDWTAATIKVKPGDLVIVRAGGLVKIAHTLLGEVGPKGTSSGSGRLDMKIGTGKAIPVGDRWVGALRDPGTIQFRVNAERYQDNSGAYRVNLIVIPVGAFPADAKVEPE